jgi:hypothetical protein
VVSVLANDRTRDRSHFRSSIASAAHYDAYQLTEIEIHDLIELVHSYSGKFDASPRAGQGNG